MKPKHGLPCGVRLTEGLGGAGGAAALALAAETLAEAERRDTLCLGVVFITGSVPERSRIRHQLGRPQLAWCSLAGERPAAGRAATTGLTPSLLAVPAMALPLAVAVLCGAAFPTRSLQVNSEQVVLINATHLGGSDARTEALRRAEFFALATPNV